jgi:tetratricopeptide (TPR) repeat protein
MESARRPFLSRNLPAALAVLWLAFPVAAAAHGPTHQAIQAISARIEGGEATASDFLARGELHRAEGEWEAAERDYRRAAQLDPSLLEVVVARAALHLDRGRPDQAKGVVDPLLSSHPDHAEALRIRAQAATALGRPLDAVRDLDHLTATVLRLTPDLYIERARLLAGCGERYLPRAVRGLDEGIARFGPIVSLQLYAVDLEMRSRQFESALKRLETLAPQFERNETLLELRGNVLAAAGREAEARQAYAAALAAIESSPPELRAGRFARELEARLRAALESKP